MQCFMMTFLSVPRMYVKFFLTRLLLKSTIFSTADYDKVALFCKVSSWYSILMNVM
jgi:hypothetical protein